MCSRESCSGVVAHVLQSRGERKNRDLTFRSEHDLPWTRKGKDRRSIVVFSAVVSVQTPEIVRRKTTVISNGTRPLPIVCLWDSSSPRRMERRSKSCVCRCMERMCGSLLQEMEGLVTVRKSIRNGRRCQGVFSSRDWGEGRRVGRLFHAWDIWRIVLFFREGQDVGNRDD